MAAVRPHHSHSIHRLSPSQTGLAAVSLARRPSPAMKPAMPTFPARIPAISPAIPVTRLQSRMQGPTPVHITAPANIPATSPAKTASPAMPPARHHPAFQATLATNPCSGKSSGKKTATKSAISSTIRSVLNTTPIGKYCAITHLIRRTQSKARQKRQHSGNNIGHRTHPPHHISNMTVGHYSGKNSGNIPAALPARRRPCTNHGD